MTLTASYSLGFDKTSGSIEIGKHADMIVLDLNLFEIQNHEISDTKVLRTVFEREVVSDAGRESSSEKAIEEKHDIELDRDGSEGHRGCEWHRAQNHKDQLHRQNAALHL